MAGRGVARRGVAGRGVARRGGHGEGSLPAVCGRVGGQGGLEVDREGLGGGGSRSAEGGGA